MTIEPVLQSFFAELGPERRFAILHETLRHLDGRAPREMRYANNGLIVAFGGLSNFLGSLIATDDDRTASDLTNHADARLLGEAIEGNEELKLTLEEHAPRSAAVAAAALEASLNGPGLDF